MKKSFLLALMTCLVLPACTHLSLKTPQGRIIDANRSNISTSNQISNHAKSALMSVGLDHSECMKDFQACIDKVNDITLNPQVTRSQLALLAELHYAHALSIFAQDACKNPDRPPIDAYYQNAPEDPDILEQNNQKRQECLNAYKDALFNTLNHSYGYLFFDKLSPQNNVQHMNLVKEDDIKTQDLYHLALDALMMELYKTERIFDQAIFDQHNTHTDYTQTKINQHSDAQHLLNIYIDDAYTKTVQEGHTLSDLVSAYDARMAKLDTTNTRFGLGVGYVGVLSDRHTTELSLNKTKIDYNDLKSRIHPTGHLLLTAVGIPKGETLSDVLNSKALDVLLFNPYVHKTIELHQQNYPLSANFSAGYALWLSENRLAQASILNMFGKDIVPMPELFMLEPYNPNKKVIIMLHGLASSPATWVNLTNNLLSDPVLQENYQVWQIFYSTNLPMLENRYQIQSLIEAGYHFSDPQGKNTASRHSVLIGHSMGGVIGRLMLSDDNLFNKFNNLDKNNSDNLSSDTAINPTKIKKLLKQTYQDEFYNRFALQSLAQVDTAVFISSPLQGTDYAERWFTLMARRIIRLPLDLTQVVTQSVRQQLSDDASLQGNTLGSLYLDNGASQLSDRSAFMALTHDVKIVPKVRHYSIMGDQKNLLSGDLNKLKDNPTLAQELSDGIVPYHSSHLDSAVREIIITGGHNIHENPKTIQELRKILYEHLQNHKKATD